MPAFNTPLNIHEASGYGYSFSLLFNFGTLAGTAARSRRHADFHRACQGLVDVVTGLHSSSLLPGIEITGVDIYPRF